MRYFHLLDKETNVDYDVILKLLSIRTHTDFSFGAINTVLNMVFHRDYNCSFNELSS